jgi:hypothetical protein
MCLPHPQAKKAQANGYYPKKVATNISAPLQKKFRDEYLKHSKLYVQAICEWTD